MNRRALRQAAWFVLLVTLVFALPAYAQDQDVRPPNREARQRLFAPVQGGPSRGEIVATHAPDHFLVQVRAASLVGSQLANLPARRKGAAQTSAGPATGIPSLDALNAQAGVASIERAYIAVANRPLADALGVDRWFMVYVPDATDVLDLVARYIADPAVEAASPDWVAFPAVVPNDPLHSIHWGHNNTAQMKNYCWNCGGHDSGTPVGTVGFDADAQPAWDQAQGYGSASVIIAILDSGVDNDHPDIRQVAGYDYGDNDTNADDNSSAPGHGTACAGVAAAMANNALGAAGAAGGCSIMPLKVANSAGSLLFSYIQNGLYHAADNGADVASMSFGAAISSDPATDTAINYAFNAGVVLLAATGNENKTTISYPAIHANVIGVGAASPCGDRKRSSSLASELNPGVSADPNGYTCDGERWWGSNYGTTTSNAAGAVDIIAPTILPTTDIGGAGGYDPTDYSKWFNGTSCATPYAAGVCALIVSANPTFTPAQTKSRLTSTAVDVTSVESAAGWDRYAGFGMVNSLAAVSGGAPTPTVTVTAPNGGETLTGGASTNITWSSTGTIANVSLDYSTNGGTSWTSITTSTPNDGSQAWTVPSTATTQGRVRVSDASNAAVTDQSNANFTITVSGTYASLPYSTGFETGALDTYWTSAVTANGRVRVLSTNTPHTGTWHLVMDDATSGGYSQTEARLRLNLAGQTQVSLVFWWKDFGDETQTQDGIYFSNNGGTSYTKVYSLLPASFSNNVWRQLTLDLDALAATAGLALNGTFVVKFQQYDDYPITTDGMAFDDIAVTAVTGGGGITAESEPNSGSTTADGPVGSGTAVTGSISSTTDDDWFYFDVATAGSVSISLAIGSSADLDWFLYNSSVVEVARGYTTANPEAGSYTAAVGRYYLFVDGYAGATASYTLTVTGGLAKAGGDAVAGAPSVFALHPNAPNPFNPSTTIRYDVPVESRVTLTVFDARGRLVNTLVNAMTKPGRYAVVWDGRDANGVRLPSGMYFSRIQAPAFTQTQKMLMLK